MKNKEQQGKEILNFLFGEKPSQDLFNYLEDAKDNFGDYLHYSCGYFYGDKTIDLKTKQLIVVATLITQRGALPQLRNHLHGCKNAGLSKEEVCSAIIHLTMYIGFPAVVNALEVINDIYP